MKESILVTGLNGLVGSRIRELLSQKFKFINLSREAGFDITKKDSLEKGFASSSVSMVIHLASFTNVNEAWKQRNDPNGPCYQINVIGTRNVASLCSRYQKFLIHFSTDFVFNGKRKGIYTEEDTPDPIEWYGQTKFLAEEEVKNSGCRYCILRISFPFRAYFPAKLDIIRKIVSGLKEKNLNPQFEDQIITPTFIDDIAEAMAVIIKEKPQGVYHLVSSSFISPYALALKVADIFQFDKNLVKKGSLEEYLKQNPTSRPYQKNLALSNKKIQKLGIKTKTIDEALSVLRKQFNFLTE